MPSKTTPGRQRRFLQAYEQCGVISEAARQANIDQDCHWLWMRNDPQYREAFEKGTQIAGDNLETELFSRARYGIEEPVIFQGEQCWEKDINGKLTGRPLTVRKYDSAYLIFALKGVKPEKYNPVVKADVKHSGAIDTSPQQQQLSRLNPEQYAKSRRIWCELLATIGPADDPGMDESLSAGGSEESEKQD